MGSRPGKSQSSIDVAKISTKLEGLEYRFNGGAALPE
jgi:hypothetical protein